MTPEQDNRGWSLRTLCVHGGYRPTPECPDVVPPISRSSAYLQHEGSYAQIAAGETREALIYTRYGNPTTDAIEQRIAALEGAERSLLFASGMAAMHAGILATATPGSSIVVAEELYGGTRELLDEGFAAFGYSIRYAPIGDLRAFERAMGDDVSLVICECLSNPTLVVADLPEIARLAHARGARLLVDATFTPPSVQRPLELGADVVMHSATKYFAGHDDVIAGSLAGSAEIMSEAWDWRRRAGGCIDPEAASLVGRGLKTLALRVGAQCDGAEHLAASLAAHPAVGRVFHPSLPHHASRAVAQRVLSRSGGVLAFEAPGGDDGAMALVQSLTLALDAPTLGGVETLVSLPKLMSHAHMTDEERLAIGIRPGLVRVSVGIEDPEDLVRDFAQALSAFSPPTGASSSQPSRCTIQ